MTDDLFRDRSTEKGKFIQDIYENILKTGSAGLCDPIAVVPIFNP